MAVEKSITLIGRNRAEKQDRYRTLPARIRNELG